MNNNEHANDISEANEDRWGDFLPSRSAEIEADRMWRKTAVSKSPIYIDYSSTEEDAF